MAECGASCPQTDVPTSIETAKQAIRANKKEEWMNEWASGDSERIMFHHMTTLKPKDSIDELKLREMKLSQLFVSQHNIFH